MKLTGPGKALGTNISARHGLVPSTMCPTTPCVLAGAPRLRLDLHSGCVPGWWSWTCLSSWGIWPKPQMRSAREWENPAEGRDGSRALGRITQGFHVMHLPVHHLHLRNSSLRKARKEVHIILVTPEKACTSLLRNVCLLSMQHLL